MTPDQTGDLPARPLRTGVCYTPLAKQPAFVVTVVTSSPSPRMSHHSAQATLGAGTLKSCHSGPRRERSRDRGFPALDGGQWARCLRSRQSRPPAPPRMPTPDKLDVHQSNIISLKRWRQAKQWTTRSGGRRGRWRAEDDGQGCEQVRDRKARRARSTSSETSTGAWRRPGHCSRGSDTFLPLYSFSSALLTAQKRADRATLDTS